MNFETILRCTEQINTLSRSILRGRPAFAEITVRLPNPENPELAFIQATSWLYCLYCEAGRVSIKFLQKCGVACSLINEENCKSHILIVQYLRTELHHNLGFGDTDLSKRNISNKWRKDNCGTADPQSNDEWNKCYIQLVSEAFIFLKQIYDIVRYIENSEEYTKEWYRRLERDCPAASFDPIIEDAKRRLGYLVLDTVKFRNRYYSRWKKQLDVYVDYDFEYEATRLIENALLNENVSVLPVTGADIINILGIPAGPQVREMLIIAKEFFAKTKCTKEELLDYLRDNIIKED